MGGAPVTATGAARTTLFWTQLITTIVVNVLSLWSEQIWDDEDMTDEERNYQVMIWSAIASAVIMELGTSRMVGNQAQQTRTAQEGMRPVSQEARAWAAIGAVIWKPLVSYYLTKWI